MHEIFEFSEFSHKTLKLLKGDVVVFNILLRRICFTFKSSITLCSGWMPLLENISFGQMVLGGYTNVSLNILPLFEPSSKIWSF